MSRQRIPAPGTPESVLRAHVEAAERLMAEAEEHLSQAAHLALRVDPRGRLGEFVADAWEPLQRGLAAFLDVRARIRVLLTRQPKLLEVPLGARTLQKLQQFGSFDSAPPGGLR